LGKGDKQMMTTNDIERRKLKQKFDSVAEEYTQVSDQIRRTIEGDLIVKLERRSKYLLEELKKIEKEINGLPPSSSESRHSSIQPLIDYLQRLQKDCSILQLSKFSQTESRKHSVLTLEMVYVQLHVERQVALTNEELFTLPDDHPNRIRGMRPLTALEAIGSPSARARTQTNRSNHRQLRTINVTAPRLILLGALGSGKSTFVNHLALVLAGATISQYTANEREPAGDWLKLLPGWELGELLPVRILLRQLITYPPELTASARKEDRLFQFFVAALHDHQDALPEIRKALSNGKALLLFDGLDEVIGDPTLSWIVENIQAAASSYPDCPILVTCRSIAYKPDVRDQLSDFQAEILAPLTVKQIQTFVAVYSDELSRSGYSARNSTDELQQALAPGIELYQPRLELHQLAKVPLLLAMIVIVHFDQLRLPHACALLYAKCINLLLLHWRQEEGQPSILAKLNLPQFDVDNLLKLIAQVGYSAHSRAEDERPPDGLGILSHSQIDALFVETFRSYTTNVRHRAELVIMLHEIITRNELLLQHDPDIYTFPYRAFQEFLAGIALLRVSHYRAQCLRLTISPYWHEAIKLMVGYQVLSNEPQIEQPLDLATELLKRSPAEQILAGEILNIIGPLRAHSEYHQQNEAVHLWCDARDTLLQLATAAQTSDVRIQAAIQAGWICYGDIYTQPSNMHPPDLRLLNFKTGQAPDENYWCAIEPSPFWFGDNSTNELHQLMIDRPYKIARFPLTNAEYKYLMDDPDAYNSGAAWWRVAQHGHEFLRTGSHDDDSNNNHRQAITQPRFWTSLEYNHPTQPVVGISWYEAAAYCRWLTIQGHTKGWLPMTDEIRLPTAVEWERAARHADQRQYPWGNEEPTSDYANYDATYPSPVGCFPLGRANCGAEELAGNVREWLATSYETETDTMPINDPHPEDRVSLTLSSFESSENEQLLCGARDKYEPGKQHPDHGFRIIWSVYPLNSL